MSDTHLEKVLVIGGKGIIGKMIPWGLRADWDSKPKELEPTGILILDSALSIEFENIFEKLDKYNEALFSLALYAAKAKIPFVYVSSSAVFSGKRGVQFSELSKTGPQSKFGKFQLQLELSLQNDCPHATIVRIGELYGGSPKLLIDGLVPKILANEPIDVNSSHELAYLYSVDLVEELAKLTHSKQSGILHLANYGIGTVADLVTFMVARTKSTSKIEIKQEGSSSEALVSHKLKLRSWQLALSEYLRRVQTPSK